MANNWENRQYINLGPKFRIESNNPQVGFNGPGVYDIYGNNSQGDVSLSGMTEGGIWRLYNDRTVEITGGQNGETHVSKSGREIRKLGARSQAELSKLGNDAKVSAANQFAEDMRPFIEPLVARGMNMSAIASHLNRLGIKTSKGGRFYQSTVSGLLRRLRNADRNE